MRLFLNRQVFLAEDDALGRDVLIKHGETFSVYSSFEIPADAPAGVWTVAVSVYGSPEVVYENALVIV